MKVDMIMKKIITKIKNGIWLLRGCPDRCSHDDMDTLTDVVKSSQGNVFLEMGSWMGFSALTLGEIAKEHDGTLVCADSWQGSVAELDTKIFSRCRDVYKIFWKRVCRAGLSGTIVPIRGEFSRSLPVLKDGMFDVVWIDGSHDYDSVIKDINEAMRLVKPGGIICGHDYDDLHPGVICAVHEVFGDQVLNTSRVWWKRKE